MKYYIIAGEVSGDLHGSFLMQSILEQDLEAEFRYWGGDKMKGINGEPVKHIKELAFMGFVAVVKNIRTILKNIAFCKKDIESFQPDIVVLIDYPGFNLRIAQWAKSKSYKVAYYIAPQVWAWKEKRVEKLKLFVDKLMVILPFEQKFFKEKGMEVDYVGHPLIQVKAAHQYSSSFRLDNNLSDLPIIALLPGSRKQELERLLPKFNQLEEYFPQFQFIIAGISPNTLADYHVANIKIVFDQTYDLLNNAEAAVVTSGTATLETALHNVPQVVVYEGTRVLYEIGKRLVKVPFISLVNLIAERKVVKELIQDECTIENIQFQLFTLLKDSTKVKKGYAAVVKKLGDQNAAKNAASIIFDCSKSK